MTTPEIRKILSDYIFSTDSKKIKALYTLIEGDIQESYDKWNDESFDMMLDKRSRELEGGLVKGVSWEEMKKRLIK